MTFIKFLNLFKKKKLTLLILKLGIHLQLDIIGFPKAISVTFFIINKNTNCTLPLRKFLIEGKDDRVG